MTNALSSMNPLQELIGILSNWEQQEQAWSQFATRSTFLRGLQVAVRGLLSVA